MGYHDLRFDSGGGLDRSGLVERILAGEVFVFRGALQHFGLFEMWRDASLRGIAKSVGPAVADRAAADGFHRIHEWVSPADVPGMAAAVHSEIEPSSQAFLDRFMGGAFPDVTSFYYEQAPNVRFHIPYDLARAHTKSFNDYAKDFGQGKLAAHGPHRDSWLGCPSNGINLWFALGRVRPGNGMTVYPDDYHTARDHKLSGDIADGVKLHGTWTFDLQPGDVIMFHTDQVHGSELNRTDETRFAVSCRLTIDKPQFRNLQVHPYVHSSWDDGTTQRFATLPAKLQLSYLRSLALLARNRWSPPGEPVSPPAEMIGVERDGKIEVALDDLPVGAIRGASKAWCVARLSDDEVVALSRRCPHAGGDLANGWIDDGNVVCPWHNLPFEPSSGKSPCDALPSLRRTACEIQGTVVVVDPRRPVVRDSVD